MDEERLCKLFKNYGVKITKNSEILVDDFIHKVMGVSVSDPIFIY